MELHQELVAYVLKDGRAPEDCGNHLLAVSATVQAMEVQHLELIVL